MTATRFHQPHQQAEEKITGFTPFFSSSFLLLLSLSYLSIAFFLYFLFYFFGFFPSPPFFLPFFALLRKQEQGEILNPPLPGGDRTGCNRENGKWECERRRNREKGSVKNEKTAEAEKTKRPGKKQKQS